ncbi:UbiH/UbiF family hydroxylase [Roseibium litorale]|uniref:UbiH/UbiF family hydroxylase n=1 Tax=Roseibium litorale TaxID=2803841 RepID=A0ABR9CJ11_9HYPH|nr:UbiH/UbiF family hydroxylase [Roseibium litorale]MBD8890825.1 UbiH/UbiF family hydroxylase [Roseibium litorale]
MTGTGTSAAPAERDFDIVVIGAGPSGLTAALSAAQAGYRTAVVAPGVNFADGRTTALLQASVDFLTALGVWDKLSPLSAPLMRMRMVDATGRLIRAPEVTFDSAELELEAFGYNLRNKDLNRVLEEAARAEPDVTFFETVASGFDFDGLSARITTADGQRITAKLCIAADGRNSLAREAAGIGVNRWSYPQVAVVMNLAHTQPHQDTSTEFHQTTGPFTLVPLQGRNSSLVCVETPEGAARLTAMERPVLERELERRAHSILGKMTVDGDVQSFPLSGLTAKSVSGPRLALIGETAHVFPPIGAQGLNLGLRDVQSLGKLLVEARTHDLDPGSADLLARYEADRRTDIASRTTAVDALNRSLLTDLLPVQAMRSAGLYLASRVGPLRRLLMREGIAPGKFPKPRLALPFRKGAA